jgi:hypothetical protein
MDLLWIVSALHVGFPGLPLVNPDRLRLTLIDAVVQFEPEQFQIVSLFSILKCLSNPASLDSVFRLNARSGWPDAKRGLQGSSSGGPFSERRRS